MFSSLKTLETDLGESLKVVSIRNTEDFLLMSKKFEIEMAECFKKIFADLKFKAFKISDALKTSLSESNSGAQRVIANCVAMLSNQLESDSEASSVNPSAYVFGTSAAAVATAPSTSAGPGSKEGPR